MWFPWLVRYPYQNDEMLNLDWLLADVKSNVEKMDTFINLNTIKYADPILWNITTQYEANTVVVDAVTGTAYISVKAVPSGIGLNNTDYWTVIFTMDIMSANKNITIRDDANNPLATFESAVGDWLLSQGNLYVVTRTIDIGEAYVIDYNIERKTVEDFLKLYIQEVLDLIGDPEDLNTEDKSSIVAAINEVLTIIGDLTDLNTEEKSSVVAAINDLLSTLNNTVGNLTDLNTVDTSNLVAAINEVLSNIGDLDDLDTEDKTNLVAAINEVLTALGTEIENREDYIVYNPVDLDSALNNIGLKEGTYNVTSNLTINHQLIVPEGAVINVASGVTLTINGDILAGRYQIFDGAGTIVGAKQTAYPEWFGGDVVKTADAFNHVSLAAKDYVVSGNLVIQKHNFVLEGVGYNSFRTSGVQGSRLVFTTGRMIIGDYTNNVINDYPSGICIKKLQVSCLTNLDCISVYGVLRLTMEDIYIDTATANTGIAIYKAIGSFFRRIYVQVVNNDVTFTGFAIKDTSANHGAGYRSSSVWLTECTFGDTGTPTGRSYGFMISGGASDIFLDKCEVAVANVGLSIDSLYDDNAVDIFINQCDFDSIKESGIILTNNLVNGAITFSDCYVALAASTVDALFKTYNSTIPIIANGLQLIGTNAGQFGFQFITNTNIIANAILRNLPTYPILNGGVTTNISIDYLHNGTLNHYPTP